MTLPPMRSDQRSCDQLRTIAFERQFTRYAEGSVLVRFGETRVLCNVSVEEGVPPFLRGKGQGWVTAEYAMLPRATQTRSPREAVRGKQGGRTQEIQRLIGRALRAVTDLPALGERTLQVDCDVLQADGGTRTAAITGSWVALMDAVSLLMREGRLAASPLNGSVAAVSVGVVDGQAMLDLDYREDSRAAVDMNFVMTGDGHFVEIQGTAETAPFDTDQLTRMLELARHGCRRLTLHQQQALEAL